MADRLKLMSDYHCFPLWAMPGNVDPDDLPLSDELKSALHGWAASFDRTLNHDYPPDSGFADTQDEEGFVSEGLRLWQELRRELHGLYEVVYFSQQRSQILPRSDDHEIPTAGIVPSATH